MSQLQNWLIKNHEPEINKSSQILSKIPSNLVSLIVVADKKTFVSVDVLAITSLCVLAPLCSGMKLFRNIDDIDGDRVVVYVASFFRSGGGKTSAVNLLKDAFLGWLDEYHAAKYHESEKLKEELEKELEVSKDAQEKRLLIKKLNALKSGVDVFIPNATEAGLKESLKNGSTPLITLDNLGKMIGIAKRNEHVGQLLKMVDEIFDRSGWSNNRDLLCDCLLQIIPNSPLFNLRPDYCHCRRGSQPQRRGLAPLQHPCSSLQRKGGVAKSCS